MSNSRKKSAATTRSSPLPSGSGVRPKSTVPGLTPLDAPTKTATDPELDARLFSLVTAVAQEEGRTYPPDWAPIADAAKRRGYLTENGLKLFMTNHGTQWLTQRAEPSRSVGGFTMTKIAPRARLALKDIARETGVPMQEALGLIVETMYDNRDSLTRIARNHGLKHPWEALSKLGK